jgi:hypothetical protein
MQTLSNADNDTQAVKVCTKCGNILLLSAFYPDRSEKTPDGHMGACKECHKERVKRAQKLRRETYPGQGLKLGKAAGSI